MEAVDNIVYGAPEVTAFQPARVNQIGIVNQTPYHDVSLLKKHESKASKHDEQTAEASEENTVSLDTRII